MLKCVWRVFRITCQQKVHKLPISKKKIKLGPLLVTNSSSFTIKVHHGTNACRKWCSNAHPGYDHCKLKAPLLTHPVIVVQMLSTVLNIIIFEDCRNQWSMSRPLLGLILLNEKVSVTHRAEPSQNASVCVFNSEVFVSFSILLTWGTASSTASHQRSSRPCTYVLRTWWRE